MTSLSLQPNVELSENYISGFFSKLPTDATKYNTEYLTVLPSTGFKGDTTSINFVVPEVEPPYCYEFAKTLISVRIKIIKADGALPEAGTDVAGINNMLHSLFASCKVKLNDTAITTEEGNYFYKAYLQNLMTYSQDIKLNGWLQAAGWSNDVGPDFNISANIGQRAPLFRHNLSGGPPDTFSNDGATLLGMHTIMFL